MLFLILRDKIQQKEEDPLLKKLIFSANFVLNFFRKKYLQILL